MILHHNHFSFFVKSQFLLSTILSKPRLPTGCLHITPTLLLQFSFTPSLWISSFSCTSLLIDKKHIWYLEVCDFEAAQMCILKKMGTFFFLPQAGLPFETLSSLFPMTGQRKGPNSSAPTAASASSSFLALTRLPFSTLPMNAIRTLIFLTSVLALWDSGEFIVSIVWQWTSKARRSCSCSGCCFNTDGGFFFTPR